MLMRYRQRQARQRAPSIYMDRARAALTLVAPFFAARKGEVLPQYVQQCGPWIDLNRTVFVVDSESDENRGASRSLYVGGNYSVAHRP